MILLSDALKKNVIVLTVSFAFFFVNISYGETPVSIYLRNGDRITGRWLNADNRIIKIDFNGQEMSVSLDEISSISITSNTISEKYLKNAEDLLMGAPSKPSEIQLKELGIKFLDKKK